MPWKAYGKMTFSARIPGRQGGLCLAQPTGTAQSFPLFESFASNLNMLRFLSHISKSSLKHFQRQKLAKFFKLPLWRPVKHGTEFKKRKTHTEKKREREKQSRQKSIEWPPFHLFITCCNRHKCGASTLLKESFAITYSPSLFIWSIFTKRRMEVIL